VAFLGAAVVLFCGCVGVQFAIYRTMVAGEHLSAEPTVQAKQRRIIRWLLTAFAVDIAVFVLCGIYLVLLHANHPSGAEWIAPPVGSVMGMAVGLQVIVFNLNRIARLGA
jgi:hypothetical protein